jgi:DNA-binding winged helix-turn-helix (wHTH) protein
VVLLKLLERPGELVAREELRRTIWSANTFVDFDAGLNTVINRLREVLRDSAEVPHFIETVPKLGYRFIASVERTDREHHAPISPSKNRRVSIERKRERVGIQTVTIGRWGKAARYRRWSMVRRWNPLSTA